MTTAAVLNAKTRLEAWARWLRRQEQHHGVSGNLLGRLLGESMEGYRRGGLRNLASDKAFACLIPGSPRPESQDDDQAEWEVQNAMDAMPRYMREIKRVLYVEFLFTDSQTSKARNPNLWEDKEPLALHTYRALLQQGLIWMDGRLQK